MSRADFRLIYDGPSVDSGTMDVQDLATALMGVGQLIGSANRVLHGDTANARVRIKATSPGSFIVGLEVDLSFIKTITDILAGPEATAAANLITFLTVGSVAGGGAIGVIKWLRGKKPDTIRPKAGGKTELVLGDQSIEVEEPVARLALDDNVRLSLERVIAEPLSRDGFDSVEIGTAEKLERVSKSEAKFFSALESSGEEVFESNYRGPFSIINLSFKDGNKWRLQDGKSSISAIVEDEDFKRKVDSNEVSFSKGDMLICDVRVITRRDDKGNLKAEHYINKIEHRKFKPVEQYDLLIEKDEQKGDDKDTEPPITA